VLVSGAAGSEMGCGGGDLVSGACVWVS
jgi:hypothetical protein